MIQITPHMRIMLYNQSVDFRKGIDGLARLCKEKLLENPFSGMMFVFRNRSKTGIKILVYDGQGFWMCYKRLSEGQFRSWPMDRNNKGRDLEAHHLQLLLVAGNPDEAYVPPAWKALRKISEKE